MTTEEYDAGHKLERMQANLAKIEGLSERLMAALARQKQKDAALDGPSSDIYMKAAQAYLAAMLQNPAKVLEHQIGFWGKTLTHYVEAQQALASGEFKAPADPGPKDRPIQPDPLGEQVVQIDSHMRAVEVAQPDMHDARCQAAAVIGGGLDDLGHLCGPIGGAKAAAAFVM